jgi:predicted transcriptional regulator
VELTAEIISVYVANNAVAAQDLPTLIASTYQAIKALSATPATPAVDTFVPAVPIKKSITPDHLISLEDGRRYKSLKRHLTGRGMTPAQHRAKWGLPHDYPMVAPASRRSAPSWLSHSGLGSSAASARPNRTRRA